MKQVFARGAELDWCPVCGGLHFDRGELSEVLRRPIELSFEGGVKGTCAGCQEPLRPARLEALAARACSGCDGVFLEGGGLEELAGERVKLLPLPDEKPRETITFLCKACGEEAPLEEGIASGSGLMCMRCGPYAQGNSFPAAMPSSQLVEADLALGAADLLTGAHVSTGFRLISALLDLLD
jgi:Zn-finger nucleic acid-binding protein